MNTNKDIAQNNSMRKYYKFQSKIYDATRWSFLFGRKKLLKIILKENPQHILEIGCGTGHNLSRLQSAFPQTQITGIDVSTDMISIAKKKFKDNPKINLLEQAYGNGSIIFDTAPDIIIFSYTLTMINPQWSAILDQAQNDLASGGKLMIVDFHSSKYSFFRKWMARNHVRMEGHMDETLEATFETTFLQIKKAYLGLWNYFLFIAEKKPSVSHNTK